MNSFSHPHQRGLLLKVDILSFSIQSSTANMLKMPETMFIVPGSF